MSREFSAQVIWKTKFYRRSLVGFLLLVFCCCVLPKPIRAQVKPVRRVLILYELGLSSPSVSVLDEQIRVALESSPFEIELYREFLETTLFADPQAQREIRQGYIHKYRNSKLDIIITLGPSPLRFLIDSHKVAFKGLPVVFGGLSGLPLETLQLDSEFTGVWDRVEPAETLETALRLRPGTRHVVVIGGRDAFDLELEAWFHQRLRGYESTLEFTYLTDLPMPQLLERLSRLPTNTIILLTHIGLDAAGNRFVGASQADPMIAKAASAPIFGPSDVDLGHGEVGGYLDSFTLQGKILGEMATRILRGESPQDIPAVRGANMYMFDWRALKRWGIKERDLPPGSIVLNRQAGFWEQYKDYVLPGVSVLVAQAIAIVGLLWQRTRRRAIEVQLRKSEEKFSKAFRRSPLAFTLASLVDYRFLEVNDTFEEYTGWKRDEVIERTPAELKIWVKLDQRSVFLEQIRSQGAVRGMEILFRKKDGQIWTGLVSSELIHLNNEPCALSLIADVTDIRRIELARRESEERFRLVANTAPVMIWMSGTDRLCNYVNQSWVDFTGLPVESQLGNGWADRIHPDDLQASLGTYTRSFDRREPFKMEYRIRRNDEEYRWILAIGVPRFNKDGSFAGYIGSCLDITDRKIAEEALGSISHKLIEAQEKERTRIARELHDDINQRIALATVELEQLNQSTLPLDIEAASRIRAVQKRLLQTGIEVQAISHRLHSSKLELLGIVAACRSFCRELTELHKLRIDFAADGIQGPVPQDVSLCVFRVLQESLQNAIKYSGAESFQVQLRGTSNEIQLTVRDDGVGFDVDQAMRNHGLGLISMRERASLVKGTLVITSKPMGGTVVMLHVPLAVNRTSKAVSGAA